MNGLYGRVGRARTVAGGTGPQRGTERAACRDKVGI